MKKISMSYNPYLKESTFDDGINTKDEWLNTKQKEANELGDWCYEFLQHLVDKYNDNLRIEFTGIERDCDSLDDAVLNFNNVNNEFKIQFIRHNNTENDTAGTSSSKIEKLKVLYEELCSTDCPFADLRDNPKIKESFFKALDNDFEIAVVATMSSGKSTLINAMLGQELLPVRNEATTATLSYIHDDDEAKQFRCKYFDSNGISKEFNPVTLEHMNKLNDNCIPEIHLYGDIVGISSQRLKLVLTDTPGPNNSNNDEHKRHTFKLIKDSKYKPMILYVLNATQLKITDDNNLLNQIAEAMGEGGRQTSDRFIFVLNKADEFDFEKELITDTIESAKRYLDEKHGIKNPKIFPCSAYFAKIIRQYLSEKNFTKKEECDLRSYIQLSIDEPNMHFSDIAPLSPSVREKINKQLAEAKSHHDDYSIALIHTGIPAIEGAISEYLEKYAVPAKITEALHSFKQIIDDTQDEVKEKERLKANKAKRAEHVKAIEIIQGKINAGDKAKILKDNINKLSVDEEMEKTYEERCGKNFYEFVKEKRYKYDKSQVFQSDAEKYIFELKKSIGEFTDSFTLDIENLINENIGKKAAQYVEEYNSYVHDLLEGAFEHTVKASAVLGSLAHMQFSSDNINKYEFEAQEKIGTHTETKIETKTEYEEKEERKEQAGIAGDIKRFFGKIFKNADWGYEKYKVKTPVEKKYEVEYEVDDYARHSYINFSKYFNEYILPFFDDFSQNAEKLFRDTAKKEIERLKNSFLASFDKLNKKIQDKLEEQKKELSSKEKLEKMIKENEKKIKWITDFNERLNAALSN